MRNIWNETEINILKEYYPKTNDIEIVNYFSGRTLTSIKVKAKRLKIYRNDKTKKENRSISSRGVNNGMYRKTPKIKGKTYVDYYGKEKSKKIKNKLSISKRGSVGLLGDKNGMFGKIPYNKGVSLNTEIKNRIRNGVINYWNNLSDSELKIRKNKLRKDWILKRNKYSEIDTIPEKITEKILIKLKIKYEKKLNIGYYNCDFVINNKIIEVQGDYWHGNPMFYKSYDKIQKKNINRDIRKLTYLKSKGYEIMFLWENDLKKNTNNCEEELKKYLLWEK